MISKKKMMSADKNINVKDILGSTLNAREALYEIFKGIDFNNIKAVHIDFTGVEFMSRSFADEFFKYRQTLESEKNIKFILINSNKDISNILKAVSNSNTEGNLKRKFNKFNHIQFTNQEALSNYLLTLESTPKSIWQI